jgi:C4-dicarboxylate transporter DctQ subunit
MANPLRTILKVLNRLEEGVLTFGLLGLALMCFVEVVSRYLFNHSFTWYEEFARYFMVFLTFLGASLGIKYGLHFCMDFVVTRVSSRLGNLMRVTSNLISAMLFAVVAVLAWQHSMKIMGLWHHLGGHGAAHVHRLSACVHLQRNHVPQVFVPGIPPRPGHA